jgi:hypothetical protein
MRIWLLLTWVHFRVHGIYLLLIPVGAFIASQSNLLGHTIAQIAPVMVFERLVLVETTSGVRRMRLSLPASRLQIIAADLAFCHSVALLAFAAAYVPTLLGISRVFMPGAIDLAAALALSSMVAFAYNVLGPVAATYLPLCLFGVQFVITITLWRMEVAIPVEVYVYAMLGIAIASSALLFLAASSKRYSPIVLLSGME